MAAFSIPVAYGLRVPADRAHLKLRSTRDAQLRGSRSLVCRAAAGVKFTKYQARVGQIQGYFIRHLIFIKMYCCPKFIFLANDYNAFITNFVITYVSKPRIQDCFF